MSFFAPLTVRKSLWPALSIVWFFGWANMRVARGWRIFYAMIMTVITVYVHVYAITTEVRLTSNMARYMMIFSSYFKIPAGLETIWLWEFKGAFAVDNAIVELGKLDDELKNFRVDLNHGKFVWRQLITIGGFFILLSSVTIMRQWPTIDMYDSPSPVGNFAYLILTLSFHTEYIQALIADLVFVTMLEAFRIRFKLVNEVFGQIALLEDQIRVNGLNTSLYSYSQRADYSLGRKFLKHPVNRCISSQLVTERVDRACRIHRRLLKVAQDVGDAFSLHLCLYCPTFFLHIMVGILSLVSFIVSEKEKKTSAYTDAITVILTLSRFLQLVVSCSNTSDEANKLGNSLYRVPINDAAVHDQMREHSVHIIQRKLRFTAGGIFVIDRKLARSIFVNIIKYIVILLQFRIHVDKLTDT